MIRPNLAPLAAVPGLLILIGGNRTSLRSLAWRPALTYGVLVLAGQAVIAWSQYLLYGSPFIPGYEGLETFFQVKHIAMNLRQYPQSYLQVYGWVPLVGLACVAVPARRMAPGARPGLWALLGLIVLNAALYVAYLPYEHWLFMRFFLVAVGALQILAAGAIAVLVGLVKGRTRGIATVAAACLATALTIWPGVDEWRFALNEWRGHARILLMGHYLREALPRNAVVLSFLHSGAVTHYTGRNVVSVESLAPDRLDGLVGDLETYGYEPVFVVDQVLEEQEFKRAFPNSRFAALDWAPRAEFVTTGSIRYFAVGDLQRQRNGERWPVDVLR